MPTRPQTTPPSPLTATAAVVALAVAFAAPAGAAELRIYYPDIEQGNSTLVVSPTGSALLIDGGSEIRSADDDLTTFIRDLIASGVVSSLDYIVATHYDEDHIGHLEDVMSYDLLDAAGVVYDRGTYQQTPSTFAYSDYAFAATFYTRTTIAPGTVIDLGGGVTVTCHVVNGELSDESSVDITSSQQFENAASVGLLVEYGDFDMWIAGDLTGNVEEYGVADVEEAVGPLVGDVDVYTVHHHGSRTGSTPDFLADITPEVAINQNSADNSFGHPNSIVVENILDTLDSCDDTPLFIQQNPGKSTDSRSDDGLADGIADPDDDDAVLGLPGTLLLVTDGTDFQISGGNVAPITLPADCSGSVTADFRPNVLSVTRSPWVPTAAQSVTVSADVRDEGSPTVTLDWSLGGVAQTPISMSQVGATTIWQGTLAAQSDGARVSYTVAAEDSASQTSSSRPQGYFSGTTDVADLRLNDADGILVVGEYAARIEGNLTVEPGVFHDFVSQIFVQDASGGIQVFDNTLLSLDRGDLVEFVGELEQFAGQTELNVAQDFGGYGHSDNGAGSAPSPTLITVADADEDYEGLLVRIDDVTVLSGSIAGPGGGNSYLTVTDDAGTSTIDVKIDEDTDIPGAGTPTQPFDVIGVLSQFDAWPPMDGGYQLVPRGRADMLSEEVNVPAVVIHEIHADPHPTEGDANGDSSVSSTQDEFVELVNTTFDEIDVSGWTLSDLVGVRHTFAGGSVIPPREAAVVFSGGSPTGDFGHADDNGLVFTASSGQLGLNNTGDTLTLRDDSSNVIQAVTYGSEGGNDVSLTRGVDLSNAPVDDHDAVSASGARYSPGAWAADGLPFAVAPGEVVISEVMYDPSGSDDGYEWIELVNVGGWAIDLSKRPLALGWGGDDYTYGGLTLDSGTLTTCETFVVGGPESGANNANPTYDQSENWSPDLQNSGNPADGVALFNFPHAYVTAATPPIDAVIYGTANGNCLLDESGSCGSVDVGDVSSGGTVERTTEAGAWQTQSTPTPGSSPLTSGGSCGTPPSCLDSSTLETGDLVLSEVLYDPDGSDDGWEWIELYNDSEEDVCLTGLSLGWGGGDYTYGQLDLSGTVGPGDTWVIGGPSTGSGNSNPSYDASVDLSPDLQNGGSVSDGVALFLAVKATVDDATVPYDAVVYDSPNTNCLLDEAGDCATPDVGDAPQTQSVERTSIAGAWQIQSSPTPGTTPLP